MPDYWDYEKGLFVITTSPSFNTVVNFKYAGVDILPPRVKTSWSEEDIINKLPDELQKIIEKILEVKPKFSPNKIAFAFRNLSNEFDEINDNGWQDNVQTVCECVASYIERTPSLNMIHMEASQLRL